MLPLLLIIGSFISTLPAVAAIPVKRLASSPALPVDFADPALINANKKWYAFATTNGRQNVQIGQSPDFSSWTVLGKDALPILPQWARGPVWAPDVIQRDDGTFVMYFSAALNQFPDKHCIGVGVSKDIEGPYSVLDIPYICPDPTASGTNIKSVISSPGVGGAIDASGFKDRDGTRYVVYKVDGNSVGSGGSCNNGNGQRATPIMLVAVQPDGITPKGPPVQILDRDNRDGPLVEAPNLVRTRNGQYALFFSSNCYTTPNYDVAWAVASNIAGPYTKTGPMFVTGTQGLSAPGGASIASDGVHMVFHANFNGGRAMYTTTISGDGQNIRSN
ncbi:Arabinanase/levansucrase/invertase [Tothia fuscella]|uniref:Arabinanase/levansucrase/invertase n=1 Tax=Tothia fuscella TaxID=1048955 RepID=A0A9P4U341_9PEZI|nr:Arabinanase/levansucrase/invertase [Tothia fuscella]